MTSESMAIIRGLLSDRKARSRYQNPKLMIRRDVSRPFYFIRVSVKRKRTVQFLGFVDETPAKVAMTRRAAILKAINASRLLIQSDMVFAQICDRFLEVSVPQLGAGTQAKYRAQIKNHILPEFGALKLCDIDGAMIERWLNEKKDAGLGWWTRTDLKAVLSAIFTAAKRWKLWEGDNPTEGVRIGRKRLVREKRLLTVDELKRLLAALPDRLRFMVLIMFGLGLRISETLGLRWSDVDFERKQVTIQRRWYRGDLSEEGETKSEASNAKRGLSPSLLQEFKSRFPGPTRRGEFVFIGAGHLPPDDRELLREEFRPVLKRLKLYYPGLGWHAFRRASITYRQTLGGATPLEAQRAARHASLDMTYLYTLSDHERETAQQQALFDKLLETSNTTVQ